MTANRTKKSIILSRFLNILIIIFAFSIVFIPCLLGAVMYFNAPIKPGIRYGINATNEEIDGIFFREDGILIKVRRGESAQSVGNRLERAGLIRNRYFWYMLCRLDKEPVKVGAYMLEEPSSQLAIHRLLVSGKQILHRVTIPEGATIRKAAAILEENNICSAQDFIAACEDPGVINSYRIPNTTMEGYLFPDTYMFPTAYPPQSVLRAMANNFIKKLEEIDPSTASMNPNQINEKVIIASIVEREYRLAEEAPLMAGVFFNRIKIGMALQSCATVEYIITEIQGRPHPAVLYNRDLEIRSPYNTYLVPGLPPGPISAPGAVALKAAFSPESTEYLYFRLDNPESGRHYFSRTHDEHIKAGQYILKSQ